MTDWEARARELLDERVPTQSHQPNRLDICKVLASLCAEAAYARAEEIAASIEASMKEYPCTADASYVKAGLASAADISRSFISRPKTRESVLEDALRSLWKLSVADISHDPEIVSRIVLPALQWKPNGDRCVCDPPPLVVHQTMPPMCPKCGGTLR